MQQSSPSWGRMAEVVTCAAELTPVLGRTELYCNVMQAAAPLTVFWSLAGHTGTSDLGEPGNVFNLAKGQLREGGTLFFVCELKCTSLFLRILLQQQKSALVLVYK